MTMGNKNIRVDRPGFLLDQRLRQREQASATIEDDQGVVIAAYFDTSGVAAVTRRARAGGGDGTTNSPEFEFHTPFPGVLFVLAIGVLPHCLRKMIAFFSSHREHDDIKSSRLVRLPPFPDVQQLALEIHFYIELASCAAAATFPLGI